MSSSQTLPIVVCLLAGLAPATAQHPDEPEHRHAERHHASHAAHGDDLHADGFHHDFSDAERWARVFDAPDRVEWQKPTELLQLTGVDPGMTVVDLGAGTGFLLGYLSSAVGADGTVVGLDIEESLVAHMRQRIATAGWTNVEARAISPDDPGLDAASTDRIFIVNTWHHLDDRPSYASRLLQALRPGGALVIVDYTLDSESGPPKAHRLAAERVVQELVAGGFEAEILDEPLPRQYVVIARQPPRSAS